MNDHKSPVKFNRGSAIYDSKFRNYDLNLLHFAFYILLIYYKFLKHIMEGAQIPMNGNHSVTSAAFASKFRSKRGKYTSDIIIFFLELFTFLTVDVKAYLPAIHTLTVYFMKDLIEGKKKFVPMDRVVHAHVPAYENLKLAEIFNEFLKH